MTLKSKTTVITIALALTATLTPHATAKNAASGASAVVSVSMAAPSTHQATRAPSAIELPSPFLSAPLEGGFEAALTFVRKTGLNKNLSLLLLETMKQDDLVVSAIKDKGLTTVQGVVVKAILAERGQYENDWDQILANTYSKFFKASELKSLAAFKEKSPYFARLITMQNQITQQVNVEGSALLETAQRNIKARIAADLSA